MFHRFALVVALICAATRALAHAGEQGFVLLLPTQLYIIGGGLSVLATVLLISVLPQRMAVSLFRPTTIKRWRLARAKSGVSCIGFAVMVGLVFIGLTGPHDPNHNALPLAVWAMFWFGFVTLQGLMGDLWRWINPWTGPWLAIRRLGVRPIARLPRWLGYWPASLSFLAFAAVLLAHPSPSDPDALAAMVACYWVFHFIGMVVFGPAWLRRAEGLGVLLRCYASLSVAGQSAGRLRLGVPGWKIVTGPRPDTSLAVFIVILLAVGSFDGLNETFWWMARIGINPLEFPGRSAVVAQNLAGLGLAVPMLVAAYAMAIWLGVRLIGQGARFAAAFCALAPAILPIAFGYHFGHYMPGFLVQIQYVAGVIADAFGMGPVHVTTGFFNTYATVRAIWLLQAGSVVVGHILAIILSHVLALSLFGTHRKAAISQLPLAIFMVGYTVFGLWLLASPRGV
ncbi:hypothetical protein [Thalassovita taeanensis]|uniref:Uncharacterized protein n=1 Tax=Thalassovita taeanensis TaxID=657014 RepID=A0A1H9AKK8_9RHOB|nr:hypothetical protein [Thalassovita taeanensis]SEP77007.1 hypothetical protein SAMN04488092_102167 [Thalassovita taeanensis]